MRVRIFRCIVDSKVNKDVKNLIFTVSLIYPSIVLILFFNLSSTFSTLQFVVDCAVSDKPRQCYTEKFGEVVVPPMLAGPNPIANIPYRGSSILQLQLPLPVTSIDIFAIAALVDIKIMDNSEDGSRVIDPTKRIFLRPVLVKILSVCPYHPSDV